MTLYMKMVYNQVKVQHLMLYNQLVHGEARNNSALEIQFLASPAYSSYVII